MERKAICIGSSLIAVMIVASVPVPVYAIGFFDDIVNWFESVTESIMSFLIQTKELYDINQLYSEFPVVKARNNTQEMLQFNDRVNGLESWKKYCEGKFNINNFNHDTLSYDKLADQYCPPLKGKSITEIKEILGR